MKRLKIFGSKNISRKSSGRFETPAFNPETQYAVIRGSICTGERVAGFKNKKDGRFTEVAVIRSPKDEQRFLETYGLDSVKTEY